MKETTKLKTLRQHMTLQRVRLDGRLQVPPPPCGRTEKQLVISRSLALDRQMSVCRLSVCRQQFLKLQIL